MSNLTIEHWPSLFTKIMKIIKKAHPRKKTMLIKDIKIVKVITTYITGEDWKFYKKTFKTQLKFPYTINSYTKNTNVCWTLLKSFFNKKKTRLIPHFFHGNEDVTDFKKKAELFNSFLAQQCSLISYSSEIPLNLTQVKNV